MNTVSVDIKKYIENNILIKYVNKKKDLTEHINIVIKRSLELAKQVPNINLDMVYVIAAYHDICFYIDKKNHALLGGKVVSNDKEILKFFSLEQVKIIREAIEDHNISLGRIIPRSIYGKIIRTADRNISLDDSFKRNYRYLKLHNKNISNRDVLDKAYEYYKNKYNKEKELPSFFKDRQFDNYLDNYKKLINDKDKFEAKYRFINKIED